MSLLRAVEVPELPVSRLEPVTAARQAAARYASLRTCAGLAPRPS